MTPAAPKVSNFVYVYYDQPDEPDTLLDQAAMCSFLYDDGQTHQKFYAL